MNRVSLAVLFAVLTAPTLALASDPDFLYHATSNETAALILNAASPTSGIQPMTAADKVTQSKFLSMSSDEAGATTLQRKASDIVFRGAFATLKTHSACVKAGAGQNEYRCTKAVPIASLECRRFLGSAEQKKWVKASAAACPKS